MYSSHTLSIVFFFRFYLSLEALKYDRQQSGPLQASFNFRSSFEKFHSITPKKAAEPKMADKRVCFLMLQ